MRWIIAIFTVVVLLIADQTWYRGYYTDRTAQGVRYALARIGH